MLFTRGAIATLRPATSRIWLGYTKQLIYRTEYDALRSFVSCSIPNMEAQSASALGAAQHPSLIKSAFRERLDEQRSSALVGGGPSRIKKQHSKGDLTARERLELLFDSGTFMELDMLKGHRSTEFGMADKQFPGDGVVTGHGKIKMVVC